MEKKNLCYILTKYLYIKKFREIATKIKYLPNLSKKIMKLFHVVGISRNFSAEIFFFVDNGDVRKTLFSNKQKKEEISDGLR